MSSRDHYRGDTIVFPVKLQGGNKCRPVNTTGWGAQVSSRSNDGGTLKILSFLFPESYGGDGGHFDKKSF